MFRAHVISSSQRPLPDNTQQKNIHAPVGFEPTFSAGERSQTCALDYAATLTGGSHLLANFYDSMPFRCVCPYLLCCRVSCSYC